MSIESILIPKSSASQHYLRSLDTQIKNILNNKSLPSDVKYNLYSQVLNKWNDVHEDMRKPTKLTVTKTTDVSQNYDLFENIPKSSHKKAKKLLNFINTLPNVSITPNGGVTIDGREVKNSNISNIVSDFILNRISKPPIGAKQLALELKAYNVPLDIITNKNRLVWFEKKLPDAAKSPQTPEWRNYS